MCKTNFSSSLSPFVLCFFCFAIWRCNDPRPPGKVVPAFYHWQTHLQLSQAERSYLDSLGVNKLYVKFFDVDWDEATAQPMPLATLEVDTARLAGLEIVPCIFITNRTLLNLRMQQVDSLASRILQKISSLAFQPPHEIQFDCDWTPQTQAKYFALLNQVRHAIAADSSFTIHHSSLKITATIRLHQFKYPEKTGVPPVDRGMLMCYNMGNLDAWETENSILDVATLKSYLPPQSSIVNRQSSIPLDLALPLFRWGVLFRDGRMIKLLNNLSETDLQDTTRFTKTAKNRYEVAKSTYLNAHYLYAGDQLRLEAVSPEALNSSATLLNKVGTAPETTIAFYHLDSTAIQFFPKEKIVEVLRRF